MRKVRDGLYIGTHWDAFRFLSGKHKGLTHVLSVMPLCIGHEHSPFATAEPPRDKDVMYMVEAELEKKCPDFKGDISRKIIPIMDSEEENLLCYLEDACKFVDDGVKKGVVLVHCAGGVSRSASVIIAYLMRKEKLSAEMALASLKKCKSNVQPNPGFLKQLQAFQTAGGRGKTEKPSEKTTDSNKSKKSKPNSKQKQVAKNVRNCRYCNREAPIESFIGLKVVIGNNAV